MSHLELKRKIGKIWPKQHKGRKIILLYHSVGETPWGMKEKDFQQQVNWLVDNTKVQSLSELIHSKYSEDLQVAITFDDGYSTLYQNIANILIAKNINATVYLNTGWIGLNELARRKSEQSLGHYPDENFMIWDEVISLQKLGWEIGSHGVNHYNFALTDENTTQTELITSKRDIEKNLGINCSHFAYPWGRYTKKLQQLVKNAGYSYAAAASHGCLIQKSEMFALPRINVDKNYLFQDFINILKGKWDFLSLIHKLKGL